MTQGRLYILSFILVLFTVPWFFTEVRDETIVGMPGWAFYSVVAAAGYACAVAWLMQRYWSLSAGDGDGE